MAATTQLHTSARKCTQALPGELYNLEKSRSRQNEKDARSLHTQLRGEQGLPEPHWHACGQVLLRTKVQGFGQRAVDGTQKAVLSNMRC